jgi:hypothetical protein
MPLNRAAFYAAARTTPFGGRLTQQNADGTDAILDEWEANWRAKQPIAALAYILATVYHETDGTLRWDIEEYGKGKGKAYGKPAGPYRQIYYGRGPEQLTHLENYERIQKLVVSRRFPGKDIVRHPGQALEKDIAIAIMFEGMFRGISTRGDFTGKALEDYFPANADELPTKDLRSRAVEARRVINGTDKADLIATVFEGFLSALARAELAAPVADNGPAAVAAASVPVDAGSVSLVDSKVVQGGTVASLGGIMAVLGPFIGYISNPGPWGRLGC